MSERLLGTAIAAHDPAKLTIHRAKALVDFNKKYRVFINGEAAGYVRNGEKWTRLISPGETTLRMKVEFLGSKEYRFRAEPGVSLTFKCEPAIKTQHFFVPFWPLVVLLIHRKNYMQLLPADSHTKLRLIQ
ncbi:hypothetical protein QPK87_18550 [Kamptonema cortianum]|nr:hypothetical protein [Geitlerinema splendidum]MDK3158558.1 hypothetical protein [Kamptonema cortianum]